jgi:integrase
MESKDEASNGTIGVESVQGRLRLRLPSQLFAGEQKYLTLGFADTGLNRKAAQAKARQIELDIISGNFDPTLAKYKPQIHLSLGSEPPKGFSLLQLWEEYAEFKAQIVSTTTVIRDFRRTRNHIKSLPTQTPEDAHIIRDFLFEKTTPSAAKKVLVQLNACCHWAIEMGLLKGANPFAGLANQIETSSKKPEEINPFTAAERDLIIAGFESSRFYSYYTPYVKFLFLTGCRTSEAVGLQWKHIAPDLSAITFCEALVEKRRKDTKTHESRSFPCNDSLRSLLQSIRPSELPDPESLVFPAPKGGYINAHNFITRAWKKVLEGLPIEYRPQYHTRHTFITLALENGVDARDVGRMVGNSPLLIYKHYAGSNLCKMQVPEF